MAEYVTLDDKSIAAPVPAPAANAPSAAPAAFSKLPSVSELKKPNPPQMVRGKSGLVYAGWSTGRPGWLLRRKAIELTESHTFEMFALATILANCVTMAADYPIDVDGTPKRAFLEACDIVFLGIYTFEMLVKMTAFGVHCGEGAYWFNGWAIFEGFIVFISWTPILPLPTMPKSLMSVLRSFRALRVLRALFIIPGMKDLVGSTLESIPALASVTTLWVLVVWLMSIIGVQVRALPVAPQISPHLPTSPHISPHLHLLYLSLTRSCFVNDLVMTVLQGRTALSVRHSGLRSRRQPIRYDFAARRRYRLGAPVRHWRLLQAGHRAV